MKHWSQRRLCANCSYRTRCRTICPALEDELPGMSRGRMVTISEHFSFHHLRNEGGMDDESKG